MSEKDSNYKSIFKATSIFGGVQIFNILITLIRGKAVAILIGTVGMGLNGLFLSGLNLIKAISSLGITESAVRDIAKAHSAGDDFEMSKTYTVFNRWIWISAILGITITICFSPLLSWYTFTSYEHTFDYVWLSITFIFGALSGGIYTLLRGTSQLKYLAQANIFGGVVGLVVALPVFYFFGVKGVVPAIIITAFANYLVSMYFKKRINFAPAMIPWREALEMGKPMVKLGISLTLINLLASVVAFVLCAFISKTGSLSDVGLYNAGIAIVDGYVGMVFTVMAADYFPRLSTVIDDDFKWKQLVNEQAELVLIILGAVLVLLISTTPFLISVLLSREFLSVQDFIFWAVLSIPLKGLVWVLGFILLAKGDNKLFLIVEISSNLLLLGSNLLLYKIKGISGLGMSMLISYAVFIVMMLTILKYKYQFVFVREVFVLLIKTIVSLTLCLLCIYWLGYPNAYFAQTLIVLTTIYYCFYELNKRMNLKDIVRGIKFKVAIWKR